MFEPKDFQGETATRLQVIVMILIGKHPLTDFHGLMQHEKRKFNGHLNKYIQNLPEEWEDKVKEDFHVACNHEIFNEKFQSEFHPPSLINTDIQLLPKEETI
jgi:hypothetical protein